MAFMGHKSTESAAESSQKPESESIETDEVDKPSGEQESPHHPSTSEEKEAVQTDKSPTAATEEASVKEEKEVLTSETTDEHPEMEDGTNSVISDPEKGEAVSSLVPAEPLEAAAQNFESSDSVEIVGKRDPLEVGVLISVESMQEKSRAIEADQVKDNGVVPDESDKFTNVHEHTHAQKEEVESVNEQKPQVESTDEQKAQFESPDEQKTHVESTGGQKIQAEESLETISPVQTEEIGSVGKTSNDDFPSAVPSNEASEMDPQLVSSENNASVKEIGVDQHVEDTDPQSDIEKQRLRSGTNASDTSDSAVELEKVKREMKMMENALQGAARQAQVCDEIILDHLICASFGYVPGQILYIAIIQ